MQLNIFLNRIFLNQIFRIIDQSISYEKVSSDHTLLNYECHYIIFAMFFILILGIPEHG